ncbi:hypothetical protein ACFVVM_27075 [Nocardia sp. NPDC058176]|uniref:hypothetical protein n=1 Tax=Nocardia sp. NPDC058176 TaxID=3346368 RepID=UPI0036DB5C04
MTEDPQNIEGQVADAGSDTFDMTLPEDSIFRKIPFCVEPRQALLFEALAYSADSIDVAYSVLVKLISMSGARPDEMHRTIRIQLFNNAWSMVDALHNMRQIITALGFSNPLAVEFLSSYSSATRLRNAMDHLKDQAGNLALKKKAEPPLIGALTYNYIADEDIIKNDAGMIVDIAGGMMVTTSIGSFRKNSVMELLNPVDEKFILGNINGLKLEGFGHSIHLMKAHRDFSELSRKMSEAVGKSVAEQAKAAAISNGVKYEDLMAVPASGFTAMAVWRSDAQSAVGEMAPVDAEAAG